MTSIAPDQATGHPLTASLPIVQIVDESRAARHRTPVLPAANVIPAWVQLAATVIAIAAGSIGFRVIGSPEPLLVTAGTGIVVAAVGILAAVFAPDVDAAVRARIDAREAGE